ncbi:hypothetical protein FHR87_000028 [Azomonas macrocytogenes]|uniref:Uncharacterized protein n=1 Tax=Azomonas macrocytogenes TaxID=69962 RepID=A0A839SXM5_AZOMA|nr:hypothetical protein [Azomonas macrocytogenes]
MPLLRCELDMYLKHLGEGLPERSPISEPESDDACGEVFGDPPSAYGIELI